MRSFPTDSFTSVSPHADAARAKGSARINRSGFTLLELVLVLAILTLVVAMIAPSLQGFAAGRSGRNLATNLLSLTRYARTQAISEGRVYRLNIDPAGRKAWLTAESGATFAAPENDYGREVEVPESSTLTTDLRATDAGVFVQFYPGGRCDVASFQITDRFGETISLASESPTQMYRIAGPAEAGR